MNNKITHDELSLSALEHIDEECLHFESAWKSNQPPDLNEFVGDAMGAERAELIRQLVLLDFDYRQKSGQRPTFDNYREQLPDDVGAINLAFRKIETDGSGILMTRSIATDQTDETTTGSLHVKCPDCHSAIELACDADLEEISCPGCGSKFNLLGNEDGRSSDARKTAGRFQLLEKLGEGGFGAVWRAQDPELDRIVAIKIPRKNQVSVQEAGQFLREARAAAQLHHPNIVSVHEVGREDDTIYIVSDFVEGETLAERIAQQPLSMREAAELCVKIADALEHAHQQGVVHRDLKPGNIMLDAAGEPHVMDFGLAKREAGEVTMTLDGNILGTPAYMSPEQAKGMSHRADRRTDIYSLGVILFEMFTGERPFRGNAQMLIKQVLEDEPPLPRSLNGNVPRDLETICLKCLEKNPDRRFASASELGGELRLFLNGQPITSRPVSQTERLVRWCKRKPALAALGALILCVAVAAPIVAVYQSRLRFNEAHAKKLAESRLLSEQQARKETNDAKQEVEKEAEKRRRLLYTSDMNLAMQAWDAGNVKQATGALERHIPPPGKMDLRKFEWFYLWNLIRVSRSTPSLNHGASAWDVEFSKDGQYMACAGFDNKITLWTRTGDSQQPYKLRTQLLGHTKKVTSVAFDPQKRFLVSGSWDYTVRVWDLVTGECVHTLVGHENRVDSVVFSSTEPNVLFSGGWDRVIRVWDIEAGKQISELAVSDEPVKVYTLTCSPDGEFLAAAGWGKGASSTDQPIRIWRIKTSELVYQLPVDMRFVFGMDFSPDGQFLAVAGQIIPEQGSVSAPVCVWDLETQQVTKKFDGKSSFSVAFSSDGSALAAAINVNTINIWDWPSTTLRSTLRGHSAVVYDVNFHPTHNDRLVSTGLDGSIKFWKELSCTEANKSLNSVRHVAYSPDGSNLVSGERILTIWTKNEDGFWANQKQWWKQDARDQLVTSLAFTKNGQYLITGHSAGPAKIWDCSTERTIATIGTDGGLRACLFSNDNYVALGGSAKGSADVEIWDFKTKMIHHVLQGRTKSNLVYMTTSADDRYIAASYDNGNISIWDLLTKGFVQEIDAHGTAGPIAFSNDSRWLASAERSGQIKIWNVQNNWRCHRTLEGHTSTVFDLLWLTSEPCTLVSASLDSTVRIWDIDIDKELTAQRAVLKGHRGVVTGLAENPDGTEFVSAGYWEGEIRIWRAPRNIEEKTAD